MRRAIAGRAFAGVVAGALAGVLEATQLFTTARRLFLTSHELNGALRVAVLVNAALGVVVALALSVVGVLIQALGARLGRPAATGEGRALALLAMPVIGVSLWALTAGSQARRIPGRPLLVVAFTLAAALVCAALAPRLRARQARAPRRTRCLWAAVLVAVAVTVAIADARLLVRLYPVFHAWLGVIELLLLIAAVHLSGARGSRAPPDGAGPSWRRGAVTAAHLVTALAALAGGGSSIVFVLTTQNTRSVLTEHAPGVSRALRAAGALGLRPPSATEQMTASAPVIAPPPVDESELPRLDVHDRDLLLVTIDALRPDHLGAYGYRRPTSPRIDQIARDSVVFDHAYSATPQTSYAVTSLLTGKYIRPLFRLGQTPSNQTLAHMLRSRGMHTAAFFTDAVFFIDRERFRTFEDDRLGFEYSKMHPLDAGPRLDQVRDYLRERPASDRLFIWVHFFEPHEPYLAHPDHPFGTHDVDLYDAEVATVDEAVGDLVEAMRARGDPIIVITADHGEEFGDHGGRYHGTTLYEEQIRVPLILRVPGVPARRVTPPVQLVDVVPTVLGLYGVPYDARVRGIDLRPLLFGRALSTRAFAESVGARMVVEGHHKLICDTDQDLCRLFDLSTDPHEERNLADARPEEVSALRTTLTAWARGHARFERQAAATSSGDWPEPIRRALLGDLGATAEVIALLASAEEPVRAKAAEILGPMGQGEAATGLVRALDDPADAVRVRAALSLVELGDRRGADRARALLAAPDADMSLRARAALGLAALGDPSAAPVLRSLVQSAPRQDEPVIGPVLPAELRNQAIERLGTLHDRQAVPILLGRIDEVREKIAIVVALAAIGDRRAVPVLARAVVDDPYENVRSTAAAALVRLGDRRACAALRRALEQREAAAGALEALVALGGARALTAAPPPGWTCTGTGCALPATGARIPLARGQRRLVLWVDAQGDGGRLSAGPASVGLVSGSRELTLDLPEGTREAVLTTDPPDLALSIRAILAVRAPLAVPSP